MSKFKTGDRVRTREDSIRTRKGSIGTIKYHDGSNMPTVVFPNGDSLFVYERSLELVPPLPDVIPFSGLWIDYVKKEPSQIALFKLINKLNKPKTNIMTNILKTVKNALLSPDEKLLRKYELHDDSGEITGCGKDVILQEFFSSKDSQAVLLMAAKLQEEEDAKK